MQAALLTLGGTPARLPDARLRTRLTQLVTALAAQAEATLAQALAGWAPLKAAYRFFSNPRVTPPAILASERPAALARLTAAPVVLIIQDTTDLDFTHHAAVRGLGPLSTGKGGEHWGVKVHSALAVVPEPCQVVGLLAQQLWRRDPAARGSRAQKRQRPTAAKESGRWLAVEQASLVDLPATTLAVTVADREGDIDAWFAAPRPAHAHLLVRAAQFQRGLADGTALIDTVQQAARLGHYQVDVPAAPGRAARTAVCSVRLAPVALKQPDRRPPGTPTHAPLPVSAILVREETLPADGSAPLCWLLVTTLAVSSFDDACRCIYWYTLRWLVERYHFVLKSGCRTEALQLETADALLRAVAVYCLVAVQVLALTYLPREQPDLPCTVALSEPEWRTLVALRPQLTTPDGQPPALGVATRAIAQLGGFLGRKGDGAPGALTLWRGLVRLKDTAVGWQLAHHAPPVTGCG
jgi:Transposase DNA-binding/Transposase Tn5 dimerisation domain